MVGPKLKEAYKWSCEFTDKVSSKIPSIVKNIFQYLAYVALFLPRKTLTVLKNILIYSLGGTIGSPLLSSDQMEEDIDEDNALQDFTCLLGSLFDDHASDINHSSIFINWQLNQPSTQVLPYDLQPSMSILPIQSEKAIGFSKNKLAEFKDLYRFSLPA
jgi:hypothetical protein